MSEESVKVTTIPRRTQVFSNTYANLPTTGVVAGDLGYATDRLVFYRWSGSAWAALTIHSSSGTAANIPAAANLPSGSIYFETDTALLKQVQGGVWAALPSTSFVTTNLLTRDLSAATGDVAYTGFGFQPRALFCFYADTLSARFGVGYGTSVGGILSRTLMTRWDNVRTLAPHFIDYETGVAGVEQYADIASVQSDGFTLSWTKVGSPTGTLYFYILAMK